MMSPQAGQGILAIQVDLRSIARSALVPCRLMRDNYNHDDMSCQYLAHLQRLQTLC